MNEVKVKVVLIHSHNFWAIVSVYWVTAYMQFCRKSCQHIACIFVGESQIGGEIFNCPGTFRRRIDRLYLSSFKSTLCSIQNQPASLRVNIGLPIQDLVTRLVHIHNCYWYGLAAIRENSK